MFGYFTAADGPKAGQLKSETIEPDFPQSCVTTTYDYDSYGNRSVASTANCAGATGRAVFSARSSLGLYAGLPAQAIRVNGVTVVVAAPAGVFLTASTNALNQTETTEYDPRFDIVTKRSDPNNLATSWLVDDFGRKVGEVRADNTRTVNAYCVLGSSGLDTSSNSSTANGDPVNCPVPAVGEAPADAVMFVHSELRDASNVKIGAFVRVYSDRLGRELRSVTESFDGAGQPGARSAALIAKDTTYNIYRAKSLETQPYFLASVSSTTSGSNDVGVTRTDHDVLGRARTVYVVDGQGRQGGVSFGPYGVRPAARQTIAYSGLVTTVTNDAGQTRREERNAIGEVVRITDATGAQLVHQRDAFGNLVATKDALQNIVTESHDVRGRRVRLKDPDAGTWNYDYDALSQLVWQQGPTQQALGTQTTLSYDLIGRLISRIEPEYASTWSYDRYIDGSACAKGIGRLCESATTNFVNRKFVYDSSGRLARKRTSIANGPSFASAQVYDATTGRLSSETFPTGLQVGYAYTPRGFLERVVLQTQATVNPLPNSQGQTSGSMVMGAGTTLWQAQSVNAWGKLEQQYSGNGVVGKTVYEGASGRVAALTGGTGGATTVLNQQYAWDSLNNLVGRADAIGDGNTGAVTETFVYGDGLNRLTGYTVAAPSIPNLARTVTLQYNALGMLLHKSDVGNFSYGPQGASSVRPHALQRVAGAINASFSYDANGNFVGATGGKYRSASYTSFNLPDSQGGLQGVGGTPKYTWQYDENHARIKETHADASGTRVTWFMHPDNRGGLSFESETAASGAISNRHYLSADGQVFGVLVSTGALPTLSSTQTAPTVLASITLSKVEYWHKDHLGSLIATTDHAGAVTQRYAYDPFGKRRYTNGRYDDFGSLVVDWSAALNWGTDRGFTGHEQLDDIGLIHMNGRVFDPALGVFLQADPLIQQPNNLQNYNRYSYLLNNPLNGTDPSGFAGETSKPEVSPANWLGRFMNWLSESLSSATNSVASLFGGSNSQPMSAVVLEQSAVNGNRSDPATQTFNGGPGGQGSGDSPKSIEDCTTMGCTNPRAVTAAADVAKAGAAIADNAGPALKAVGKEVAITAAGGGVLRVVTVGKRFLLMQRAGQSERIVGEYRSAEAAREAAKEAGTIRGVNAVGGKMNCVNCSIATDATLAGRPASALGGGPFRIDTLEKTFGGRFGAPGSIDSVSEALSTAGPGARGIVFGSRGNGEVGHVFNVVNQNGVVRYLDGQTGRAASLQGFQSFQLLRTN